MRCLHCDQKLPFYARILGSHFCGAAHKKAYNRDRGRLVVEAFQQTALLIRTSAAPALGDEFMSRDEFTSREPVADELLAQ